MLAGRGRCTTPLAGLQPDCVRQTGRMWICGATGSLHPCSPGGTADTQLIGHSRPPRSRRGALCSTSSTRRTRSALRQLPSCGPRRSAWTPTLSTRSPPTQREDPCQSDVGCVKTGDLRVQALRAAHHPTGLDVVPGAVPAAHETALFVDGPVGEVGADVTTRAAHGEQAAARVAHGVVA